MTLKQAMCYMIVFFITPSGGHRLNLDLPPTSLNTRWCVFFFFWFPSVLTQYYRFLILGWTSSLMKLRMLNVDGRLVWRRMFGLSFLLRFYVLIWYLFICLPTWPFPVLYKPWHIGSSLPSVPSSRTEGKLLIYCSLYFADSTYSPRCTHVVYR